MAGSHPNSLRSPESTPLQAEGSRLCLPYPDIPTPRYRRQQYGQVNMIHPVTARIRLSTSPFLSSSKSKSAVAPEPVGNFRPRHPNPPSRRKRRHSGPISSTSLTGRNPEISDFQFFGARKCYSENTSGPVGTITEPIPERIHFVTDISG
jgi:hypothetical protein